MVGASAAYWDKGAFDTGILFLALVGALLSHVSVNVLNDVGDFKSQIDFHTEPTPFSGGSGYLVRGEIAVRSAHRLGVGALVGTVLIGIYFVWKCGWQLLPLGVIGVILVVTYTPLITRSPWICLVAPGLGFGPIMVMGVAFCLAGSYEQTAMAASLVPGFLVSTLLLLNQFPDVAADAHGGRSHIPIRWGLKKASRLCALLMMAPYMWLLACVATGVLPAGGLLALFVLPISVRTAWGILHHYGERNKLIPLMGQNVAVTLATPVLMALGIILDRLL
jgi:1,4-dihydroxy-2-naphthoate octaprenyltransferase